MRSFTIYYRTADGQRRYWKCMADTEETVRAELAGRHANAGVLLIEYVVRGWPSEAEVVR